MGRKAYAPFLELDLGVVCAGLGRNELLEVTDSIVGTALHTHCGGSGGRGKG